MLYKAVNQHQDDAIIMKGFKTFYGCDNICDLTGLLIVRNPIKELSSHFWWMFLLRNNKAAIEIDIH